MKLFAKKKIITLSKKINPKKKVSSNLAIHLLKSSIKKNLSLYQNLNLFNWLYKVGFHYYYALF